MAFELRLGFEDPGHATVLLNRDGYIETASAQPFTGPLDLEAQRDLQWYLEIYPVQYTTEIDDDRAGRVAAHLDDWGAALFNAVFTDRAAERLFNRFQDSAEEGRLLTVSSDHPAVLAQPWELLREPNGTFLFLEKPGISIRRQLAGSGREPYKAAAKERLHLLFVVSRPTDAGFIDPRADAQAVMDAIEAEASGRVTYEFLRPATLRRLIDRLADRRLPRIDILHFDGHGAYDPDGRLATKAAQASLVAGASQQMRAATGAERHQGYLWFEKEDRTGAPVSAGTLGDLLHRRSVGLVVLSACQSAMIGGEDPMGSVAARLTYAGLPSILAMTQSVLVHTTRALFGHLYRELARGESIGAALDHARLQLYADPTRGERQRSEGLITLSLQDWFLPALYQVGIDTPLLSGGSAEAPPSTDWGNLLELQESGFYGRRRELWEIEQWFVGGTRRVVVHGFGGQGKTYLAEETGRWLRRADMFACVCFVGYAEFQGSDAVGLAVSTLGTVLGQSLLDAKAVTNELKKTPTLVILDNLEALSAEPLNELLDAAVGWAAAGTSRVLVTTRSDDLNHHWWPKNESNLCRYLSLQGLAEEDALDWLQALMKLPPKPQVRLPARDALRNLFAKVGFHPLSIRLLARELKTRRIAELGGRLEALLAQEPGNVLLASLNLSLERLDPQSARWLPRLGVFQGGAFEDDLVAICELDQAHWKKLRQGLEHTGLVKVESMPGIEPPFLHFHPTLAPVLWSKLSPEERVRRSDRYRDRYYHVSMLLHLHGTPGNTAIASTAMAMRDLPNLLAAVGGAFDMGDPSTAVDFASRVMVFLQAFGLRRDWAALNDRAQRVAVDKNSPAWSLAQSNHGELLYRMDRYREAEVVFTEILSQLGDAPSIFRCTILRQLSRCCVRKAELDRAELLLRRAIAEIVRLESILVLPETCALQSDLGKVLAFLGRFDEARDACESSLAIAREIGDRRGIAVNLGELGKFALYRDGDLDRAESAFRQSSAIFRELGERQAEAVGWNRLGIVYQRGRRFEAAEQAFRESARIMEEIGDRKGAADGWYNLAQTMALVGRPAEAEAWFRKALDEHRAADDPSPVSSILCDLANLLAEDPRRLTDARACAEQALAIGKTLHPVAAKIWEIYSALARIAGKEGDTVQVRRYRRCARETRAATPEAQEMVRRRWRATIFLVATAASDPVNGPLLAARYANRPEETRENMVGALRRILTGERDEDLLCDPSLDEEECLVVQTVLRCIADTNTLDEFRQKEV